MIKKINFLNPITITARKSILLFISVHLVLNYCECFNSGSSFKNNICIFILIEIDG